MRDATSRRTAPLSRLPKEHKQAVVAFVEACGMGDVERLMEVLDPEVVFRSDGGGQVPSAGSRWKAPSGSARALLALERKRQRAGREMRGAPGMVNGRLGFVYYEGKNLNVLSFTVDAGRIVALDVVRNPDKLRQVRWPSDEVAKRRPRRTGVLLLRRRPDRPRRRARPSRLLRGFPASCATGSSCCPRTTST